MTATECGEFRVRTQVNGQVRSIIIKEVLIVPYLKFNLLSVRKLEMNGYTVQFCNRKGIIQREDHTIAVAYRKNKLYELEFSTESVTANVCNSESDIEVWHKRFGHISYSALEELPSMVNGIKWNERIKPERCEVCITGKQTKLPHSQTRIRAKRPLQLVHSDVCSPMGTESYDRKRYLLTFIDDFTHFTVAYTLTKKSEVFKYFKQYQTMAEAHFNSKLSRLRCDNGREYLSTK